MTSLTLKSLKLSSKNWETVFDLSSKEKQLAALQKESEQAGFWRNKDRAIKVSQKIADLKQEIEHFRSLEQKISELKELLSLAKGDENLQKELSLSAGRVANEIRQTELKIFLAGPYDQGSALLEIFSGAGGQDAQDWARMLLRMYKRYAERKGWQAKVLHQSFGPGVWAGEPGIKEAALEVAGKYAYGFLKGECGVHRLVRISPFSPQNLRHTSFVRVDVLPLQVAEGKAQIELKLEDLKFDTFRASGPGGQYVNRRESAVRVHHLPTGLVVSCQSERLQGLNRAKALEILKAKLLALKQEQLEKKKKELGVGNVSASWGNQIRSYVMHPYKQVKDLRTNFETHDIDAVLDGDLDPFIETQIQKLKIEN